MVRSIRRGPWLINYRIHGRKVIELLHASKRLEPKGWPQGGGERV